MHLMPLLCQFKNESSFDARYFEGLERQNGSEGLVARVRKLSKSISVKQLYQKLHWNLIHSVF